jgi:F0F1-type ATP synthase assembly protein I
MAKLMVGILVGLVLGLYLDSAAADGAQPLAQIETAIRNLLLH